ncbi:MULTISPECIES: ABC transporter permease [Kytococcus]|uniref:ABC transporter permease n=1 Tax=Kytococcus schroeteri TaxID=138300 RepID=A0A2I1P9C3_9MICO|nr:MULTISPECIES: ABC transporter permease [Kytococcus]OFS07440.1 ABC transporter permease [Kytococcus sp. HMSC28H12]PKZ41182.1 ABC transporter permease [Kytococcus schroeteri]
MRELTRTAGGRVALGTLAVLVLLAVVLPLVVDDSTHLVDALQPPSAEHWAGTDHAGRDLLVRVAQGLRVSLLIAALSALVSVVLGVLVGAAAASLGRWADALLMRTGDAVSALPHLVLGLVVVALYPGSVVAIVASIALTHWPTVARLVRAEALAVRSSQYVDAARLAGASRWQLLRRHLVPAALPQALVAVVLLLPHAVFHESTLSFFGLGLQPTQASLGTLLAQARSDVQLGAWWSLVVPALALGATTVAVGGLGRGLTDALRSGDAMSEAEVHA